MLAALAFLLPAVIALAVWVYAQLEAQRHDVVFQAQSTARQVLALADAEAAADAREMAMIANAPSARENNLGRMSRYFDTALENNPSWRGLVLRENATGRVLIDKGRGGTSAPLLPLPKILPGGTGAEMASPVGRYCPCVTFHARVAGPPPRTLTLYVDPQVFQDILVRFPHRARGVSALVDRQARFLARSIAYPQRVARPGSAALQQAVARGGQGIYPATTLEGVSTYTAHATSPLTGWSAHVAVESDALDTPHAWGTASAATAIAAALLLAVGLTLYAMFETRRRQAEETRLVGMQKAEAVSRFTGTVAHDFRNILSVIDAGVRLILRHSSDEAATQRARAIGDAVERGNRLVNQLLSFVRGDGAEVEALDLAKCIAGADALIAGSLGDQIEFRWHVDDDARHARANADQLELALLNLAINARDAMNGEGTFSLAATRDGEWVAIAARDNGPGVPGPLRDRVFEAFFSTKEVGKGTGLGLAQVAGAARQAGGHVELSANSGGGACFTLYLPRADGSEPRAS